MQLPAISSLVSLLSSSITGLKDPFKPTAVVAATYLALLHLVLIFPPLRDNGFLPIVAFERLPTVWQVVLGTFLLFILSFILNVMGESFLNLVNGRTLQYGIPELASLLKGPQITRFRQLHNTIRVKARSKDWTAEDAADELAYEFPDEERDLAPTKLGNILLSPASYTYRQYGARLDTIWPILFRKIDDEELLKQITGEMEAIIFLATMSTLSVLMALEMGLVVVWFGNSWGSLLWCLMLLSVAIVFYWTTFPKARAWGLGIRTAFDQHLDLARQELGLRELTDPVEKQQRWRDVSAWLSIGPLRKPSPVTVINTEPEPKGTRLLAQNPQWYQPPVAAAKPLTVTHPPNVTVSDHSAVIAEWPNTSDGDQPWHLAGQEIAYVIAVTNQSDDRITGTCLQIVDTRLPALPVKVFGALGATGGGNLESFPILDASGSPQRLLWFLPPIPAGGTQVLRYQVRFARSITVIEGTATITQIDPNAIALTPTGTVTFVIDVMNKTQLAPLSDVSNDLLSPVWADNETDYQTTQRATFQATSEVRIHWDGQRFVTWFY